MSKAVFDLAFLQFQSASLACDLGPDLLLFTRASPPKQSLRSVFSCLPAACTDRSMDLTKIASLSASSVRSTLSLLRLPRPRPRFGGDRPKAQRPFFQRINRTLCIRRSTISPKPTRLGLTRLRPPCFQSPSARHLARAPRPQGIGFWSTRSGSVVLRVLPSFQPLSGVSVLLSLRPSPFPYACVVSPMPRLEAMHLRRYTVK